MIDGPVLPASGATRCQISSVTNGISGWMSRSTASSTRIRVRRVPRSLAGPGTTPDEPPFDPNVFDVPAPRSDAPWLVMTVFESSRYQSQYSFQVKS